ncbi:MAG: hypothetical protein FWD74_05800 [Actinomycetia bacterium]|nr:hypothetical protein [Actinomycetes bacterium]
MSPRAPSRGADWTRTTLNAGGPKRADRKTRSGPRRAPFVLLVIGLLAGGMVALVALNTASAAAELRRNSLLDSNATLSAQVQQLQTKVADRRAPGSLASAAAALGMVPAGNPAFVKILPDGTAQVLGSAQPASAPPPPVTSTAPAAATTTAAPTPTTAAPTPTTTVPTPTTATTPAATAASQPTGSRPSAPKSTAPKSTAPRRSG